MNRDAAIAAFQVHAWIHKFPWQHVETLAGLAEEAQFKAGDVIFREGDPADKFYFINAGDVGLEAQSGGRTVVVEVIHPGEEIGWSAMMDGGVRRFTARAQTDIYAIALTGYKLAEHCERNPAFGLVLMKHLVYIAAERLDATRLQLIQSSPR